MKVTFKQPRSLGGVDYPKGTHEVPDALASHWYLLACIQNGTAVVVEKPGKAPAQPAPQAPPQEPVKQDPPAPAANYHEHMAQWESKKDKAAQAQAPADPVPAEAPKEETPAEKKARKRREKRAAEKAAKQADAQKD